MPSRSARPPFSALGANEKLNIGLIGSGNRGRTISTECVKAGHNVVATARHRQVPPRLVIAEQLAKAGQKDKPATYDDYRKLLEHKGLDAVIIATPGPPPQGLLARRDGRRTSTRTARSR